MQTLREALNNVYGNVEAYLPTVLVAAVLVLAGLALGGLLRLVVSRFLATVAARLAARGKYGAHFGSQGLGSLPRLAGGIVFWLTLFIFGAAALEQLNLDMFAGLLGEFASYLPNVFIAILVVSLGVALGRLAREGVRSAMGTAGVGGAGVAGRVIEASIILVAGVVAADQVGVDSTFLMLMIGITLGTTLGGMALAFGIGSGPVVANIIASYYVRRMYHPGLHIRIGEREGRIVEIRPTTVALETLEGRVEVPCRHFLDDVSTVLREQ